MKYSPETMLGTIQACEFISVNLRRTQKYGNTKREYRLVRHKQKWIIIKISNFQRRDVVQINNKGMMLSIKCIFNDGTLSR